MVRAANGRESVVPNEMFMVNRVENLSLEQGVAFNTKLQIDTCQRCRQGPRIDGSLWRKRNRAC